MFRNQAGSSLRHGFRGLYGITDDQLLPEGEILTVVESALEAGLGILQYRSKQGSAAQKTAVARQLLMLCQSHNIPLIINDDVGLCQTIGADGVHLGQEDSSIADARRTLGPTAIIGITCHDDISRAEQAQQASANYVAFGRFFPSQTKPTAPPASIEVLTQAKKSLNIPIVAIGGINAENGRQLVDAGADMLAVIHSIFGAKDVADNVSKLIALFD